MEHPPSPDVSKDGQVRPRERRRATSESIVRSSSFEHLMGPGGIYDGFTRLRRLLDTQLRTDPDGCAIAMRAIVDRSQEHASALSSALLRAFADPDVGSDPDGAE